MENDYLQILRQNETLPTKRLLLRAFKQSDAEDVLAYGSDPQALKYLVWEGVKNVEEAGDSIAGFLSNPGTYAIALASSQRCIGCIGLRVEPAHEKASFGYVLHRQHWGHGYMTEALAAVLQLCFETLALHRVESTHYVGNEASGRVMQKCGMRLEGVGAHEVKVKGIFHDVVHYGITQTHWQSLHPSPTTLSPSQEVSS